MLEVDQSNILVRYFSSSIVFIIISMSWTNLFVLVAQNIHMYIHIHRKGVAHDYICFKDIPNIVQNTLTVLNIRMLKASVFWYRCGDVFGKHSFLSFFSYRWRPAASTWYWSSVAIFMLFKRKKKNSIHRKRIERFLF